MPIIKLTSRVILSSRMGMVMLIQDGHGDAYPTGRVGIWNPISEMHKRYDTGFNHS